MKLSTFSKVIVACSLLTLVSFFNLQGQPKSEEPALGYSEASYTGLSDNQFLKNWLILGPVKIFEAENIADDAKQKDFFDKDAFTTVVVHPNKSLPIIKIGNTEYSWKLIKSEDGTLNFSKLIGDQNYAIAYAMAEIKMEVPVKVLMGIGSDDGIKLFLNGKLVHNNWIGRPTIPDDDLVLFDLKKGSNQILVKIQNMEYGWGFTMRKLGKEVLNKLLVESSGKGDFDKVKQLVSFGADVDTEDEIGLTAYQNASINGREKVMSYLKEKGAETDKPMPSLEKLVDRVFKNVQAGITPGVSVLISENGKVIYEKGFGYADVGNKVPVTPDTKFRIGSITKQFIAASILKLQEEGKLSVQDKLSKYIPDFPRGDEVTIHHLLTHTSGIQSYTNRSNFAKYLTMPISTEGLIDTIKAYPYEFNPGDKFFYNNSGYFLLGYIIKKVSGKSLDNYLQETFFKPLGMNNSGIYNNQTLLNAEAYGYSYNNGMVMKAINWDMSWAGGAGAIYSTTRDLNKWNEALFNGKVLTAESLNEAFTPIELNNKEKTYYAYGLFVHNYRGNKVISHGGGLNGFLSYLLRQPDKKINVVVLCNSTPSPDGINPTANALQISEYLLWPNMAPQSCIDSKFSLNEDLLKRYVGRYDYGTGAVLRITQEGKLLGAQLTGQPKFVLLPISKDEFYWKTGNASLKFVPGDNMDADKVIVNQENGLPMQIKKLKDEEPVNVSSALFSQFAGKYDVGSNFIVVISKDGDKLFIQGGGLPKYQLWPASEIEFFTKEMNVRMNFKPNSNGKNDSALFTFSGINRIAKRIND